MFMPTTLRLIATFIALILLSLPAAPAWASGDNGGEIEERPCSIHEMDESGDGDQGPRIGGSGPVGVEKQGQLARGKIGGDVCLELGVQFDSQQGLASPVRPLLDDADSRIGAVVDFDPGEVVDDS